MFIKRSYIRVVAVLMIMCMSITACQEASTVDNVNEKRYVRNSDLSEFGAVFTISSQTYLDNFGNFFGDELKWVDGSDEWKKEVGPRSDGGECAVYSRGFDDFEGNGEGFMFAYTENERGELYQTLITSFSRDSNVTWVLGLWTLLSFTGYTAKDEFAIKFFNYFEHNYAKINEMGIIYYEGIGAAVYISPDERLQGKNVLNCSVFAIGDEFYQTLMKERQGQVFCFDEDDVRNYNGPDYMGDELLNSYHYGLVQTETSNEYESLTQIETSSEYESSTKRENEQSENNKAEEMTQYPSKEVQTSRQEPETYDNSKATESVKTETVTIPKVTEKSYEKYLGTWYGDKGNHNVPLSTNDPDSHKRVTYSVTVTIDSIESSKVTGKVTANFDNGKSATIAFSENISNNSIKYTYADNGFGEAGYFTIGFADEELTFSNSDGIGVFQPDKLHWSCGTRLSKK